jgi:phenylacetate-CoA ligase
MSMAEDLYQRSPRWAQTVLMNLRAVGIQRERYGPVFRRIRDEWEESQWWDTARMREWQDAQLRDMVRYCHDRIPYYRRKFSELRIDPLGIAGVADLPRLPLLTKEDVKRAGKDIMAPGVKLIHGHTSGTTGTPLSLWYDQLTCIVNNVADWRQKGWAGLRPGDWCGVFLGRVIVPTRQTRPPFWRNNYLHKHLWFSAFHMSDENLPAYVGEIRRRGLQFLEGYPSTLFILARHLNKSGVKLPMRAVFTSSETLHRIQREAMAEAFQCPVFDFYGHAERCIFAGECGESDGKHLCEEYGVTEVVDDRGQPVPIGESGWLVGTSLWNRGMPLLRYRTSDISSILEGSCPCGRKLRRMAAVSTKAEDIVVTPDGRFVSPSVLTHPFKPYDQILKSQLIQDAPDRLLVKIVPSSAFGAEQKAGLLRALQERVGDRMRLDLEVVDDIPPERSGKFRWVISRVKHDRAVTW